MQECDFPRAFCSDNLYFEQACVCVNAGDTLEDMFAQYLFVVGICTLSAFFHL